MLAIQKKDANIARDLSTLFLAFLLFGVLSAGGQTRAKAMSAQRPLGPCDVYAAGAAPCVAAHSTTRALIRSYTGPLYQVLRQSDGKSRDIGVVPYRSVADPGGYADAASQDEFCKATTCWIALVYDQSGHGNDLSQAPRGGFSGPALGGMNNLPLADAAPVIVLGHKVYGIYIMPGMGLRNNRPHGTAVDDQAEGTYWVINGHHYNSGCCFDYGNAEIDSRDDGNGTMETTYFGDSASWFHGVAPGPWVMTDQENNLMGCVTDDPKKLCKDLQPIPFRFVTGTTDGERHHWRSLGGNAQSGKLAVMFDGRRLDWSYDPMRKQGAILLGNGGDNSNSSQGTFYEGAMTVSGSFPSRAVDDSVQQNVVAARYGQAPADGSILQASRIAPAVRINEFRIDSPTSKTDSFIELYNATKATADLSGWTVHIHPAQQAQASEIRLPEGTYLKPGGFYLLALAPSGLAAPAAAGDRTVFVRSTDGLTRGGTVQIGNEVRRVSALGSAASDHTTVWQPVPDGPILTVPAGSSNVPVQSADGFAVGQKIALGYGSVFPATGTGTERFEIATVTAVGKPGTQSYLAAMARPGDTNLKVLSVEDISAGDTIQLDIDSKEHGVETIKVRTVGTRGHWTRLAEAVTAGATRATLHRGDGVTAGTALLIGTPANIETVSITAATPHGEGVDLTFTPALRNAHQRGEWAVSPGTGLELDAPLEFAHAANLPFSVRGTGIDFTPATAHERFSNEPVQVLGTGITLDQPLRQAHPIHEAVLHDGVGTSGYQGAAKPSQWFGGPELQTRFLQFGHVEEARSGSLLLRDRAGAVMDAVNYGAVVDPWLSDGDQGVSGGDHYGCFAPAPKKGTSTKRTVDGHSTGSACKDFVTTPSGHTVSNVHANSNLLPGS